MMTDRKQWKKVETVVRDVIHKWDPYGLIGAGAPKDEWDSEILKIVGRLQSIRTPLGCAVAISDAFSIAFQSEEFKIENCDQVGQQLFDALNEAGLIQHAEPVHAGVAKPAPDE